VKYLGDVLDIRSDEKNKVIHELSLTTETAPTEEGAESLPEVFWGISLVFLIQRANPTRQSSIRPYQVKRVFNPSRNMSRRRSKSIRA
jgi:hypothetical protein